MQITMSYPLSVGSSGSSARRKRMLCRPSLRVLARSSLSTPREESNPTNLHAGIQGARADRVIAGPHPMSARRRTASPLDLAKREILLAIRRPASTWSLGSGFAAQYASQSQASLRFGSHRLFSPSDIVSFRQHDYPLMLSA